MDVKKLAKQIKDRETAEDRAFEGPLHPPLSVLCALGSIAVHAEELLSPTGHRFDIDALRSCFTPEVRSWIKAMGPFMPVKR